MWNPNHVQQSQKFVIIIELPLEDDKFPSLQENNLKIWDLRDKVKEGEYKQFYFVKNNVLFRSIVDNGNKFEARVIQSPWEMLCYT